MTLAISRGSSATGIRRGALGAVVAGALVLRLGLAIAAPLPSVVGDPAMYDEIALSVATGHGFARLPRHAGGPGRPTAVHPPAWPGLLAGADVITGQARPADPVRPAAGHAVHAAGATAARWRLGRVLQALLGVAAVVLLGVVARALWGDGVGLVAAGLGALYPAGAVLGLTLLGEPLFIVLMLGALAAVLRHRAPPHRRRWVVLAGALIGLATLTRNNGLVLLLPLGAGVWIARPRTSWRAIMAPLALVAAALAVVAPWTVRNAVVMHAFVPVSSNIGKTLAGAYNAPAASGHHPRRPPRRPPQRTR